MLLGAMLRKIGRCGRMSQSFLADLERRIDPMPAVVGDVAEDQLVQILRVGRAKSKSQRSTIG